MRYRRIHVIGTSGAGKTTLARELARRWDLPHVELDALYWGPDWTPAPDFRKRVAHALRGDEWVVDSNYGATRDMIWARAEMVVWLDYALPVIVGRVLWRTIRRSLTGEELWHGNRERLRQAFFSRRSIILWALSTYHRRRRRYRVLLARPEYAHLHVVHLPSPRAARRWIEGR